MKKPLALFVIVLLLTLSIALNQSVVLSYSTGGDASKALHNEGPTFLQDTPEHVLDCFYTNLLLKKSIIVMSALFYQQEHYTQMTTDALNSCVSGYKDLPLYTRQSVNSSDYALYTIAYSLEFKDIDEPVPFLDVLPLIKQDGKWYIYIENPTATPLEQAITELYADPAYSQAEADYSLRLQDLLTKYPDLVEILA